MPRLPRISTHIAVRWAKRHAQRFPAADFQPFPPDTDARILVVNTTGIGDTIFATAVIADLRESFPNAEIDVFVDRRRESLVEHNPRVTRVIAYPGKYKRVRATIRELRARRYDVAVIQHANDPDVVPMVTAARAGAMIGFAKDTFSFLYAVALPPAKPGVHTIDARLAMSRAIGGNGEHWHTELFPDDADRAQAAELLHDFGLAEGEAVALNLGGSLPSKRWPVSHWCALARVLSEQGRPCVFVGGVRDQLLAEIVRGHLTEETRAYWAVGSLPIMASASLLKLCAAHVSGDTGLMQAGLALDVPTVGLFGPDDPAWTGPHPNQKNAAVVAVDRAKIPEGYSRKSDRDGVLMKEISVDQVLEALESLET